MKSLVSEPLGARVILSFQVSPISTEGVITQVPGRTCVTALGAAVPAAAGAAGAVGVTGAGARPPPRCRPPPGGPTAVWALAPADQPRDSRLNPISPIPERRPLLDSRCSCRSAPTPPIEDPPKC